MHVYYELTRLSNIALGTIDFHSADHGDDAVLVLKITALVAPTVLVLLTVVAAASAPLFGVPSAGAAVVALFQSVTNYRTVIGLLLVAWFAAYNLLSVLVRRNVEHRGLAEFLTGEVCWKGLHRSVGEWDVALVQLPDQEMLRAFASRKVSGTRPPRPAPVPCLPALPSAVPRSRHPTAPAHAAFGMNSAFSNRAARTASTPYLFSSPAHAAAAAADIPDAPPLVQRPKRRSMSDFLHPPPPSSAGGTGAMYQTFHHNHQHYPLPPLISRTGPRSRMPTSASVISSAMSEAELSASFGSPLCVGIHDWHFARPSAVPAGAGAASSVVVDIAAASSMLSDVAPPRWSLRGLGAWWRSNVGRRGRVTAATSAMMTAPAAASYTRLGV
ncbi:hypothetical protein H9P43_005246 [Blastocladiella emersonii ATCC 22665]|nr:hypothetical protein H9P43_005246 [Blastocladiella emersonii ATCC 22665]